MNPFRKYHSELLYILLIPAVRFALRHAVGTFDLLEVLKTAYIRLATKELEKSNNKVTLSRLSAMTGITRKEIKRIAKEGWRLEDESSIATRVVGLWSEDSQFLTKSKQPRMLSHGGKGSEFEQLVRRISTDIGPAAILFQLELLDLVERVGDKIKLKKIENVSFDDPERALALLARDTTIFSRAVEENTFQAQQVKNLYLCTHYDNISKSDLLKIRKWLYQQGQIFHKRARAYLSRYDADITPHPNSKTGGEVSVVTFSWTTKQEPLNVE